MKRPSLRIFAWLACLALLLPVCAAATEAQAPPASPTPGMVTMLDLGAHKCIPCRMMAPIIKELAEEYKGLASILFIDVWENPAEGKKYGLRGIPTQIFYDKDGKEVSRHMGFMDKKTIKATLEKLGAPPPKGAADAR
ncbi:MAG: thioredoxin family protein [Thermodesulfobacteriota bacterium]